VVRLLGRAQLEAGSVVGSRSVQPAEFLEPLQLLDWEPSVEIAREGDLVEQIAEVDGDHSAVEVVASKPPVASSTPAGVATCRDPGTWLWPLSRKSACGSSVARRRRASRAVDAAALLASTASIVASVAEDCGALADPVVER
jgi:hypothetical protein